MALMCDNCGAPMGVVEGRGYLYCDYCHSFHFEKEERSEGVVVLNNEGTLPCPACSHMLVSASLEDQQILYCPECRGMLMKQKSFAKVVEIKRAEYQGRRLSPRTRLNQKELQREAICPHCNRVMETHPYYGPGRVIIDSCSNCYTIWLDSGEHCPRSHGSRAMTEIKTAITPLLCYPVSLLREEGFKEGTEREASEH